MLFRTDKHDNSHGRWQWNSGQVIKARIWFFDQLIRVFNNFFFGAMSFRQVLHAVPTSDGIRWLPNVYAFK